MRVRFGWPEETPHWTSIDPHELVELFGSLNCVYWPLFSHGGNTIGAFAICPHCGLVGAVRWGGDAPMWSCDGNFDSPTLSPSVMSNIGKHGCGFHCFVRDGQIIDAGTPAHGSRERPK